MATITRVSDSERASMRRSMLGDDQGPSDAQQGGWGYPGGVRRLGFGDPEDPTAVSFPFLRRMRRDHMVAMGLHFISMPIVRASWFYEGTSAQVCSFADHVLRPIYGSLVLTLLRMLWAGYSPAARNYDFIVPDWVYYEEGKAKKVWDNGVISAPIIKSVIPLVPESAMIRWDEKGNFSGIDYDARYLGPGNFIVGGQSTPSIDVMHSLWATHDKEGEDGSPYGFPRIAHCAPIFYMYRYMWTLLGRAFEDNADPGPVVRFPREEASFTDEEGKTVKTVDAALNIGRMRRSGSTIALPSDTYKTFDDRTSGVKMWDLDYPKGNTDFDAIQNFIGYLEASKLRAIWVQEQGLVTGSGETSNRNTMSEAGDQRDASQGVLMSQLDTFIDEVLMKPIISMAFPEFRGELRKKTLGLGDDDNDIVRQFFQLIGQEDWKAFGIDARRLAESSGFPMLDPAEQERQLEQAAKQAKQLPTPTVEPTQGRRAHVTQSGFGETVYHQLGDQLNLEDVAFAAVDARDGDFVSGLPKTDVYADSAIVREARKLNAASHAYLAWSYGDFAGHVRKALSDDDVQALALENDAELLAGDKVQALVGRVLRGWRPRQARLDAYAKTVRAGLARVLDRAAGQHAVRLGSDPVRSIDRDAAAWLDERGAVAVKTINDTTRRQLASALAAGVRAGHSADEVAADVSAHFEDFPATRSAVIARTEIGEAYNYATVQAGAKASVKMAQLVDGNGDKPCRARNGRVVTLEQAARERLAHPQCTLYVRLLPKAPNKLSVERSELVDGLGARYDAETETVVVSLSLSEDDESKYMLVLGDSFV